MEELKIEFGAFAREIQHAIDTGTATELGKAIGRGIAEEAQSTIHAETPAQPKRKIMLCDEPTLEGWMVDYSQLQEITEMANKKPWKRLKMSFLRWLIWV